MIIIIIIKKKLNKNKNKELNIVTMYSNMEYTRIDVD